MPFPLSGFQILEEWFMQHFRPPAIHDFKPRPPVGSPLEHTGPMDAGGWGRIQHLLYG